MIVTAKHYIILSSTLWRDLINNGKEIASTGHTSSIKITNKSAADGLWIELKKVVRFDIDVYRGLYIFHCYTTVPSTLTKYHLYM